MAQSFSDNVDTYLLTKRTSTRAIEAFGAHLVSHVRHILLFMWKFVDFVVTVTATAAVYLFLSVSVCLSFPFLFRDFSYCRSVFDVGRFRQPNNNRTCTYRLTARNHRWNFLVKEKHWNSPQIFEFFAIFASATCPQQFIADFCDCTNLFDWVYYFYRMG